jgi:Succinate dehydrogenase/fumarate reductase, flavoprotein subunit
MSLRKFFALGMGLLSAGALLVGCSSGKSYDVVVVGSGAAGLSAAVEAAAAGAKVAVIEKLPMVGGSTILSAGYVYGTGTSAMTKLGIKDSVDDLVKYWGDRAEGKANGDKLKFVAENSGATIDWLVGLGVKFEDPVPAGTSPVPRSHRASDGGAGIIKPLKAAADAKKVEFFMESSATKLVTKSGKVTGVVAKSKGGKEVTFNAKAVVLATGGYDRNEALMEKYSPNFKGTLSIVAAGNTGDGLTMAQAAGAAFEGKGSIIGFKMVPGESTDHSDIINLMWMPWLSVNQEGKRFVNEASDYPVFDAAVNTQTNRTSYLIFDGATYMPALDQAVQKGEAFVADTLPELAKAASIDEKTFMATVASYNKAVASGKDAEFGKSMKGMKPIAKSKFYALKVVGASIGTMGGPKTDVETHVLNEKGDKIPGLYAAGEVSNGDFYNMVYPASGTSVQMSLTFGREAGQKAAEFAKAK